MSLPSKVVPSHYFMEQMHLVILQVEYFPNSTKLFAENDTYIIADSFLSILFFILF